MLSYNSPLPFTIAKSLARASGPLMLSYNSLRESGKTNKSPNDPQWKDQSSSA